MQPTTEIRGAFERARELESGYARSANSWWLEDEEMPCEEAERAAAQAVQAADGGDLHRAFRYAKEACRIEKQEFGADRYWRPLLHQIRNAVQAECKNIN